MNIVSAPSDDEWLQSLMEVGDKLFRTEKPFYAGKLGGDAH